MCLEEQAELQVMAIAEKGTHSPQSEPATLIFAAESIVVETSENNMDI